jgi:hypothetical protein
VKYTVTEVEPMESGDRCFKVHTAGEPDYAKAEVWYSEQLGRKRAWCCRCSGVSAAMLGSCRHANAVKRFVKKL